MKKICPGDEGQAKHLDKGAAKWLIGVEFDAHKTVKKETEVKFATKDGRKVDFEAKKSVKVPVHVKFTAHKGAVK